MYKCIADLKQGTYFIIDNKIFMKLPEFCSCYGQKSNAINVSSGTMMFFNENTLVITID